MTPGRHELSFRNDHHAAGSVYLANALVPDRPGVLVAGQARDTRQREIRITYDVEASRIAFAWPTIAGATLLSLVALRTRAILGSSRRRIRA